VIFRPQELPDARATLDLWRDLAVRAGLPPLYIVCQHHNAEFNPHRLGFDASMIVKGVPRRDWRRPDRKVLAAVREKFGRPGVYAYDAVVRDAVTPPVAGIRSHPCVIPNWDNTPRTGTAGLVLHESTPERFRVHLRAAVERVSAEPEDERLVFIKSWNEWAEGNHLEPDRRWGLEYLEVVREELFG